MFSRGKEDIDKNLLISFDGQDDLFKIDEVTPLGEVLGLFNVCYVKL